MGSSAPSPKGLPEVLDELTAEFKEDARATSVRAACVRVARVLTYAAVFRRLFGEVVTEPSYLGHVAKVAPHDPYFFAAHRVYLVNGLGRRARAVAALQHYRNETRTLDAGYQRAVYHGEGLTLWRHEHEGTVFEIRLMVGNDVLYEGGLSVTFFVDGQRVTVLSYSNVAEALLGARPADDQPLVPFVTRRQSSTHPFRQAFTAAFDRGTPGHFCIAALEGIALAQGSRALLGIPAERHPSFGMEDSGQPGHLLAMYDEHWAALGGERCSQIAWRLPLPLAHTPLAELNSKNRRRAIKLRGHQAAVRRAAFHAYRARLLDPPAGIPLPESELHVDDAAAEDDEVGALAGAAAI
jgi:uncharacterized protein VirK/YbjX